ncbi:MAG: 16S rRNA (adenine(1518)-N(6)/adenine(1519)-N(6))-dimethyltransferase RsmA [Verrucomicrobiota bacterium]|jgi:16S rRNA (adenine1518-N6/adenine1519-N6)-dimethyltransferase
MNDGPLSPNETRDLLARLSHMPKKWLGQNFLIDGNIVRKSLELGEVKAGDKVVEVGPGLGTLTRTLLCAGVDLYAVEADRTMHFHLTESLQPRFPRTFHLTEGDAVDLPRAGLVDAVDGSFKVVANLPYAISTPWMDAICAGPHPSMMVLMLQREAAERLTAEVGTGHWSAVTAQVHLAFDKIKVHPVPAQSFNPPPKVDSCLLVLRRRQDARRLSPRAREVARMFFTQRRKQVGSSAKNLFPDAPDVAAWLADLPKYGLTSLARPETIPAEAWLTL